MGGEYEGDNNTAEQLNKGTERSPTSRVTLTFQRSIHIFLSRFSSLDRAHSRPARAPPIVMTRDGVVARRGKRLRVVLRSY